MKPLTVVTPYNPGLLFEKTLLSLTKSDLVERVEIISQAPVHFKMERCRQLIAKPLTSHETLSLILAETRTNYLLLMEGRPISFTTETLEKILKTAESTNSGLVYSDFYDESEHGKTLHPLNDYQPGSVRDDFDFGAMILFAIPPVQKTLSKYNLISGTQFAGLYDLRLKVSIDHSLCHLQEPLYSAARTDESSDNVGVIHESVRLCRYDNRSDSFRQLPLHKKIFAYVNSGNRAVQKEMETVFTDYLRKIGAYLPSHSLKEADEPSESFPVETSIIIPVRNRKETIAEAVKSALSQETDFPFNVITVDNHSTDGTSVILSDLVAKDARLIHRVPKRTDLGIGGCWNEALQAKACGRYAVQLDSDDLYSSSSTLQKMIDMLRQGNFAMVIGSYTLVSSRLEEIPPGLIDHGEWTDENGHNNALRINGLGAPRAFNTSLMRRIGFLNVSYGEDYAAALRICRHYRIGRIFESLYLCRRWPGNTDAALTIKEMNRNNAFKDRIRTEEIAARQGVVREGMLE
jgi:hypothetical protein